MRRQKYSSARDAGTARLQRAPVAPSMCSSPSALNACGSDSGFCRQKAWVAWSIPRAHGFALRLSRWRVEGRTKPGDAPVGRARGESRARKADVFAQLLGSPVFAASKDPPRAATVRNRGLIHGAQVAVTPTAGPFQESSGAIACRRSALGGTRSLRCCFASRRQSLHARARWTTTAPRHDGRV